MVEEQEPHQQQRESVLFVFYLLMSGGTFFVLLFAICGGMILYMAACVVGVFVFALFHWLLWGQSFSRAVLAEREAELPAAPPPAYEEEDPYRGRY